MEREKVSAGIDFLLASIYSARGVLEALNDDFPSSIIYGIGVAGLAYDGSGKILREDYGNYGSLVAGVALGLNGIGQILKGYSNNRSQDYIPGAIDLLLGFGLLGRYFIKEMIPVLYDQRK